MQQIPTRVSSLPACRYIFCLQTKTHVCASKRRNMKSIRACIYRIRREEFFLHDFNAEFQHLLFTHTRRARIAHSHYTRHVHVALSYTHTPLKRWEWQVESNVALEVLAQHFDPSWMEFRTMPHSGEKNSLHHEAIAQEIMEICSISGHWVKNTLRYGTAAAQKV